MQKAPVGPHEQKRLEALLRYKVLDTAEEQLFDDITRLASSICSTPISLVSFVDDHRQWFKSHHGLNERETPKDISFCGHAILQKDIFEINDAAQDPRFSDNPLVIGGPKIHFYAGAPLITPKGQAIGTLCVIDRSPRILTTDQRVALETLAKHVISLLELKITNQELHETNLHYDSLTENMIEGMVIQDHEGKIIEYNSRALEILGLTADQLLGKTSMDPMWRSIKPDGSNFPGEEHPTILALKTGKQQRDVLMGVTRVDDVFRWFTVNTTPVFENNSPNPTHVLCTFNDVTEEKKLLNDIKKSEEKFRALFEHAPIGMVELDEKRNYVEVNNAFLDMIQYSREELKNISMFHLTHPDDLALTKQTSIHLTNPNFSLRRFRKRYVTKNGSIVWGQVSSRSFGGDQKNDSHLFSVIEDITEQKKLEENIKLQEAKLIQSSKMSALGEMAAGMAHEINNPLAIIGAYAGVLKSQLNKPSDLINLPAVREKLTQIEKTVERVAKIIRGLRIFSRNVDQDPVVSVPVIQVVDDTLVFCQERLKYRNIQLKVNVPAELTFMVRPSQITQVLLNLLNNSYDSIFEHHPSWIEVSAIRHDRFIHLMVADSGEKIPAEIQEKMMLPFFTTKAVGQGTGLGLSISQGIVESHGGRLYYDQSSPQNRFVIELPYDQ